MSLARIALSILAVAAVVKTMDVYGQTPGRAAEVNGMPILSKDVDAKLGNSLGQLLDQVYNLRQKQLDTMIDQKLLEIESEKQGVTIAALVETEITSRVPAATAADAKKFYEDNKSSLQGDLKTLEDQIRNYLTALRVQTRQQEYMKVLRSAAKIDLFLERPPTIRSEVVVAGFPTRGDANAPITLVEFSDFHCPYCRKAETVLEELRVRYAGKVKFVYRDFPLDSLHPQARAAAEASHCALDQGKFWEFHDRLFKIDDATQAALSRIAKDIGLDFNAFESCRNSGKYKNDVQASSQEGARLGINATPTFFINGRIVLGAQPIESFVSIIEQELAAH
jgi:protein-disulfide isomerase